MATELLDPPVAVAAPALPEWVPKPLPAPTPQAKALPKTMSDAFMDKYSLNAMMLSHQQALHYYAAFSATMAPRNGGMLPMPTLRAEALAAAALLADLLEWWGPKGERWVSGSVVREVEKLRLPANILSLTHFRPKATVTACTVVRRACIVDGTRFRETGEPDLTVHGDTPRVRYAFAAVQQSLPAVFGNAITAFNDFPGRKFAEVASVVRCAISKLEAV